MLTPVRFNSICIGILIATTASAMVLAALLVGDGVSSGGPAAALKLMDDDIGISLGLSIAFVAGGLGLLWRYAATEADGSQ